MYKYRVINGLLDRTFFGGSPPLDPRGFKLFSLEARQGTRCAWMPDSCANRTELLKVAAVEIQQKEVEWLCPQDRPGRRRENRLCICRDQILPRRTLHLTYLSGRVCWFICFFYAPLIFCRPISTCMVVLYLAYKSDLRGK